MTAGRSEAPLRICSSSMTRDWLHSIQKIGMNLLNDYLLVYCIILVNMMLASNP
jgi:hypothetical protein